MTRARRMRSGRRFASALLVLAVGVPALTIASGPAGAQAPAIPDDGLPPVVIAGSDLVSERTEILDAGVSGLIERNTSVDSFPNTQSQVLAFAELDGVIYVGGKFTDVEFRGGGSVEQSFLAAFDRETGAWIDTFRPVLDGAVWDLEVLPDGRLAVGGQFTTINGSSDTAAIAIVDPVTGEVGPERFAIRLTGSSRRPLIRAMDVESGFLYLGGNFTRLTGTDGVQKNTGQIARIRLSDGRVDGAFLPNVGGVVFDVDADGDRVYLVGDYTLVNGEFRPGLAVVAASNGQLVPGITDWVRTSTRTGKSYQQAVLAVDDEVWQTGSQHNRQVYRRSDHDLIRSWVSDPWGDGQALVHLNGIVYSGSHAGSRGEDSRLYRDAIRWPELTGATGSQPIRWMAAFDRSTDEQLPWVPQIGADGEGSWELFADSTDCLWTGGDFFRGSFDGDQARFASGFARFCAADQTPPEPPAAPSAELVGGGVNLAWEPSPGDDRDGDDIFYEVLKNDDVFASFISITTFRDPDGTPDDRYFVRAMDRTGNRSATTRVFTAAAGPDTSRPSTPGDLAAAVDAEVDPNDVTLTWTPSIDDVGVTEYQILRNGTEIGRTPDATFLVIDAPDGDSWFQVRAFDAAGNESFKTPPVKVTIIRPDVDTSPPSTPQDLTGIVTADGDIELSWTAATDDVGVTEYLVYRNNVVVDTVTEASALFVDPPVGSNWMQVRALDAAGNEGFKTPPIEVVVPDGPGVDTSPPTTPRDLAAVQVDADVTLTWTPSTDDVGVTEYQVLRNGTELARTPEATFVVSGAPTGTSWFQIRAFDAAGNQSFKTSPLQFEVTAQPGLDTTNPTTPQDLTGVVDPDTQMAALTWGASADDVGVTEYQVLRNGVEVARVDGATLEATVTASPGGNWYQIRAFDAAGNQSFKTSPLRLDL